MTIALGSRDYSSPSQRLSKTIVLYSHDYSLRYIHEYDLVKDYIQSYVVMTIVLGIHEYRPSQRL